MNTLGKKVTSTFFKDATTGYAQLQARWSALVQDKDAREGLTAAHYLLYAILRGKDWRKGFTEDTNVGRLANGSMPFDALGKAMATVKSTYDYTQQRLLVPFGDLLADDVLVKVRALLPETSYSSKPAKAYTLVEEGAAVAAEVTA